ncbi:MAG: ABC transporter ATP-binding protein [Ruminococcus sp.]|nr:ABC transporter ATP-binding protein [Candidatus Copronaster equi]
MHQIKRILKSVREYKIQSILSPLFIMGEVIIECLIPFITAKLIDNIQNECDMSVISKYGIILVIMAIASLCCGALAGHFCSVASTGFAKNLRHDLFYAVQNYSFSNIDKFSSSSLVTRLTTDITNVQNSYMMIIRTAIRSPFMLIFSIVMTIKLSPTLTTAFLAMIPFLIVGIFVVIIKALPLFKVIFKRYDALNNSVQENVAGIRAVKSFVRERYENQKFNFASDNVCKDFTKAEKLMAYVSPLMQGASYVVMIIVSIVGAKLIVTTHSTELTVGSLSSVLTYGMQVLMSLLMVSVIFVMVSMSLASINRIVEVLDDEIPIKNPANPVMEVKNGSVDFENVNFAYSEKAERNTLENINLHIKSGETVGIIGSTGSGKTSLIQLISRLYDVKDGSVKVGGIDVRDYDIKVLRDAVSVVLQKNVLFSGTIKDNLRWGNKDATDEEIQRACKLSQAHEFVLARPDGYDTFIERGGANVSGGQKQRLCIARALLKNPKILILDDSTSAVDTRTDALIRKAFAEELPNTTKIIIAQRISSVQNADKIVVLNNGTINAIGTHDELVKNNDIYREVFESQNRAGDFDE